MGFLSHRVERNEIAVGDHIYTWRSLYTYSHHGIYVGENKVVHFNGEPIIASSEHSSVTSFGSTLCSPFVLSASYSMIPPTCPNMDPDCGSRQSGSGVILSCLDCFLSTGSLYRTEYGVSAPTFIAKFRGGTCTMANSDPPQEVIHRAMYLLQNGFGNYDVVRNNCEDFALYCKTGLLAVNQKGLGRSGQVACVVGVPVYPIISGILTFLMSSSTPVGVVTNIAATYSTYCKNRYAADIGARTDVVKVEVEDMAVFHGRDGLTGPNEAAMDDEHCEGEITRDQVYMLAVETKLSILPTNKSLVQVKIPLSHLPVPLWVHRVERKEIAAGDHIYTWRTLYAYSHHGIYVGGNKVVHFTGEQIIAVSEDSSVTSFGSSTLGSPFLFSASSSMVPTTTCPNMDPDCGSRQPGSGVILSCLDCFLSTGSLYRFEYGVGTSNLIAKFRGGTCTMTNSDPPQEVIQRAMYLLQNGFGNYDVFRNNCKDFAFYCKTGLLVVNQRGLGRSGHAACVIVIPVSAIISCTLKLFMSSSTPVEVVTNTAATYFMNRYAAHIGVTTDVGKVKEAIWLFSMVVKGIPWMMNFVKESLGEIRYTRVPV